MEEIKVEAYAAIQAIFLPSRPMLVISSSAIHSYEYFLCLFYHFYMVSFFMSFVDSSDRLQPFFYNLGHAPSPPLCQK
jgi:hypothetical protein